MKKAIILLMVVAASCTTTHHGFEPYNANPNQVFYTRHDKFTGITYYRHRDLLSAVMYYYDPNVEVYFIKQGNINTGRVVFQFFGSEWIFMDQAILVNDQGDRAQFTFSDTKQEVLSGGMVLETADLFLSAEQITAISTVMNGTGVQIQLSGEKRAEYTLSEKHQRGNITMLAELVRLNNMSYKP